jgi:hypothetical protein
MRPAFEDAISGKPIDPANDDGRPVELAAPTETPAPTMSEVAAPAQLPAHLKDPLRAAASEELQRAIEQTSDRVERWMADQRERLGLGIDAMVASLKEQRDTELSRIEEWKVGERERAERQLAEEKEKFHGQLMEELVEFEHQLGERLREQEERLAKWWDEAEQLTKQRFADFGLSTAPGANDSPKA